MDSRLVELFFRADQLIENYRRTSLLLFLRDKYKYLNRGYQQLREETIAQLNVRTRLGNVQSYNPAYDKKFNMPLQLMLKHIDKSGLVTKFDDSKVTSIGFFSFGDAESNTLLLLINVALVVIRVEDYKILELIPLVGTLRRRTSKNLPAGANYIEIYFPKYSDLSHTFIFSSELDKQEWDTKIMKVQRMDPDHPDNRAGAPQAAMAFGSIPGVPVYR